ncbi:MAG: xanthine dehydrogenase small subunit [Gammaproteobacteria bacterium]|nr:xanthine dehydrogenase small subunit [Gammaproteobacteria bacterium]
MSALRFILDGEVISIDNAEPTRSVLQYLREDLNRVGSKEGCAEGDCGACTVVIAEEIGDKIHYRAVNACIQFLPTLNGKALFTVESLKQADGSLHPLQQSMVDYHASQCGFCSPGFAMSLFALYNGEKSLNRATISDALSGNLCRCTGYKPIIEAGLKMKDYPLIEEPEQQLLEQLRALKSDQGLNISASSGNYHAPANLDELAELYQQYPDATILAGGTDVGLWVSKQLRDLKRVIYLGNVGELKNIDDTATGFEIGAAVSLEQVFTALSIPYPELTEFFHRFASMPVRNAGTLVGNIANGSPIGDSMPILIAIGARVRLRRGSQSREMDLEDLYIDYQKNAMQAGEFIESVFIPARDVDLKLAGYKLSKRFDQDISAVCAAFALRLDGGRVADIKVGFGGMAAIVKRAAQTEVFLTGKDWNEENIQQAMQLLKLDFQPMTDMRASAAYRSQASANLLYRFYLQTSTKLPLNVFEVRA